MTMFNHQLNFRWLSVVIQRSYGCRALKNTGNIQEFYICKHVSYIVIWSENSLGVGKTNTLLGLPRASP